MDLLEPGTSAVIKGLNSLKGKQFNGKTCTIVEVIESFLEDQYKIRLDESGQETVLPCSCVVKNDNGLSEDEKEYVMAKFREWDADGDGTIDKQEIKIILVDLFSSAMDNEEDSFFMRSFNRQKAEKDVSTLVSAFFREADKNNDAKVNFEELVDWLLGSKSQQWSGVNAQKALQVLQPKQYVMDATGCSPEQAFEACDACSVLDGVDAFKAIHLVKMSAKHTRGIPMPFYNNGEMYELFAQEKLRKDMEMLEGFHPIFVFMAGGFDVSVDVGVKLRITKAVEIGFSLHTKLADFKDILESEVIGKYYRRADENKGEKGLVQLFDLPDPLSDACSNLQGFVEEVQACIEHGSRGYLDWDKWVTVEGENFTWDDDILTWWTKILQLLLPAHPFHKMLEVLQSLRP